MSATTRNERMNSGAAALWASAFVLLAMVVVQAGRLNTGGAAALAGDGPAQVDDLTALTPAGGDNEDVLCVMDKRGEMMFVYGVSGRQRLELYQAVKLGDLFAQARAAGAGGHRP